MREIKFRVWDKKAKRMEEGFHLFGEFTLLGGVHSWQHESGIEGNSIERLADLVEMEFIGLKDMNRKDIYEGDIFTAFGHINEVIERDGAFGYLTGRGELHEEFHPFASHNYLSLHPSLNRIVPQIEIIGNIYESPELLNPTTP